MTTVHIKNFEPISNSSTYEQFWSDVWLTYTVKPGRTKKRLAPSLATLTALARDLELDEDTQKEHPELNFDQDVERAKQIIQELTSAPFAIRQSTDPKFPEIYTAAQTLNRRHVEAMLSFYFTHIGLHDVKFKWKRTKPSEIVIPVIV